MDVNEDSVDEGAGNGCAVLDVGARAFAGVWVESAKCVNQLEFVEEKV